MCHKTYSAIAYTLLALVFLYAMLFVHFYFSSILFFISIALFSLATIQQTFYFLKENFKAQCLLIEKKQLFEFTAVILGSLITFIGVDLIGFSNILSSCIVGVIAALWFKPLALPAFTGSFVGMSSVVLFDYKALLIASVISGFVFVIGRNAFQGIGGKLGSTAFIGTLLVGIFGKPNTLSFFEYGIDLWHTDFTFYYVLILILSSAFASFLTHYLSKRYLNDVVLSSSLVGILGLIIVPFFFSDQSLLLETAIYCASFAGMSSEKAFKNSLLFIASGAITGYIFFASSPIFIGLGGKLGTCAFIATLGTKTIVDYSIKYKRRLQNG